MLRGPGSRERLRLRASAQRLAVSPRSRASRRTATCDGRSNDVGYWVPPAASPGAPRIVAAARGLQSVLAALLDLASLDSPPPRVPISPIRTSDDDKGKSSTGYRAWSTT